MPKISIPPRRVFQVAYVVPDLDLAIQQYARELNLGAWIVFQKMQYAELKYRGASSNMKMNAAMACSGDMMYELIQQLDDLPSVYMDTVSASGYGFHHFGVLATSLDDEIENYTARGFEVAMEVRASNGARGCYIDTRAILPGMMEILQTSEALMEFVRLPYEVAQELGDCASPTIQRY
jgi:Glyoxalase/Bleomycin resistance protein/Dioxygenase superfamily